MVGKLWVQGMEELADPTSTSISIVVPSGEASTNGRLGQELIEPMATRIDVSIQETMSLLVGEYILGEAELARQTCIRLRTQWESR